MDIYSLLDAVPTTLGTTTIHYLMDFGKSQQFEVGDVIFREGDPSQKVYIILNGEASVIKKDAFGGSNVIATAKKGAVFGEMGLFLNLHRSGTITAKTALSVLTLSNEDFISALQNFPDLSLRMFKALSLKLDAVNGKLSNLLNSMTMVQLGTYMVEHYQSGAAQQRCLFDEVSTETQLKRRDIVNALINYSRLQIISGLQFKEDDQAAYSLNLKQLTSYLKQISLRPSETELT